VTTVSETVCWTLTRNVVINTCFINKSQSTNNILKALTRLATEDEVM